jgi:phytoene dehydrogenase-like protein
VGYLRPPLSQPAVGAVTVVGGGLAGLVAAITAAEQGVAVALHDASRTPGGHAHSSDPPFVSNFGPHAIYGDGDLLPWLRANHCAPRLARPPATGFRVRLDGRTRRAPLPLLRAIARLTGEAPRDVCFAQWAGGRARDDVVQAAIGMASLPCFHPDPGALSAAFVAERLRRVTRRATSVRYVVGGWSQLTDSLVARARSLGVTIRSSSFVSVLPPGPVVLACGRHGAERLLATSLPARTTRVALLDVGLHGARRGPFALADLDERTYVARYSRVDRSLCPPDHELVQASAPLRDGEDADAGQARLELALEAALPDWRERIVWRRAALSQGVTGAVDGPGEDWRGRTAVARGDNVFLAGDYVAAPGMLGEVAWASGVDAGTRAAAAAAAAAATARSVPQRAA